MMPTLEATPEETRNLLDRYGPRTVWVISLVVLAVTCFAHWKVADCQGPPIYVLRIMFTTALAGALGAWTTLIVTRFPGPRMPEILSLLGTAGFIGMMVGAHLGDDKARPDIFQPMGNQSRFQVF